jgi:hypothetical protein
MGVPVWLFAIVAAAVAPLCVRLYASMLQQYVRRKTEAALADHENGAFPASPREETKGGGGSTG